MKLYSCIAIFGALFALAEGLATANDASACYNNEKYLLLWDLIHSCISKARDIHLEAPMKANCGFSGERIRERSRPYLEMAKQLIQELEENYPPEENNLPEKHNLPEENNLPEKHNPSEEKNLPDEPETVPSPDHSKPLDCSDVLRAGHTRSGVYTIWPAGRQLDVYCDMDTDGGGWTVIQRRGNFSKQEDFYRGWNDYAKGFGNITRDFWLGNENIHLIANQSQYEIRFDLTDAVGGRRFAAYQTFWLDDESKNYTLHIGDYSGNAGDSMAYHNGHVFTAKDSERSSCARQRMAAWWFDDCTDSNLNGVYRPGMEGRQGITWYNWHNTYSLAGSEMKLRKKNSAESLLGTLMARFK